MGVVSRRVLPVCGNLCIFCPSMRARSRQPVKRYKKLLADIFPKSLDEEPNERKISKLCEYASKNPLRMPKITEWLEQRCYRELRHEHFGQAKIVVCIYRNLLVSCKEHMPLYANSLLCIIKTLLDQTQMIEMHTLGCHALVDFINCQKDGAYMFCLEGIIPKLCQVAKEVGDGEKWLCLRSAALQALACMVWFMAQHSHISIDFDDIVAVTLENYEAMQMSSENIKPETHYSHVEGHWVQEVIKVGEKASSFPEIQQKATLLRDIVHRKSESDTTIDIARTPMHWSRVCLQNMASLAKEATTVRRILEPVFLYFDAGNHWFPEKGFASSVLSDMQSLIQKSGENDHLLLSVLVKHLDHKNVIKQPQMKISIVNIATQLAQQSKEHASVAIIAAITDLMKHLRRCIQCSMESSQMGNEKNDLNPILQEAIEQCILQSSNKVGDSGIILDTMAAVLENISATPIIARATVSAVYRTSQIVSSIPNLSHRKKAFPEALFHELLLAMAHPDHETRVIAHRILSVMLVPLWDCTGPIPSCWESSEGTDPLRRPSNGSETHGKADFMVERMQKDVLSNGGGELTALRLSSHQVGLLLSSIWSQATLTENFPSNFEAMAHTYTLALMFSRVKTSSQMSLIRCFQLAFTLRRTALEKASSSGFLQQSHRRSLFTLASFMLKMSVKAGNLPQFIPLVKETLTNRVDDSYVHLVQESRLQGVSIVSDGMANGSQNDEASALDSLSATDTDDSQLKELFISLILKNYGGLSKDDFYGIKKQLMQEFLPDDSSTLGVSLFMETPQRNLQNAPEHLSFDEITQPSSFMDDDPFLEESEQSDYKGSLSPNAMDVLSVTQLMDSVLETARQVASSHISIAPVSYDQMKNHCEALIMEKQQKMSILLGIKHQQEPADRFSPRRNIEVSGCSEEKPLDSSEGDANSAESDPIGGCNSFSDYGNSFKLPPSSPYDKFLRAAGC